MGQKKNKKLLIILIIVLVVLILAVGVSFAYFATDIFKGNKELFFKYITQMGDSEEGFIEPQIANYFEKQKNTPYKDEGTISLNITSSSNQQQYENVNNMNLTFSGQVNNTNNQAEQNISLNYSDSVNFPLIYRKDGEVVGIQTDYIGSKFIATNLNKEDEIEGLSKVQELSEIQLSEDDLQYIKNTYLNVLNAQLQDSYFSKIEETNDKGYKLTLNGENLKSILLSLLETLKNDQRTLDKMNEYIKTVRNSARISVSDIDNMIKDINNENSSEISDLNIEITVYQNNKKANKVSIKINEYEIKLEKSVTGNDIQYNIELVSQEDKIGLIVKYSGLQSMQSITENYELTLASQDFSYQYNYSNIVDFIETSDIETFNDDNSLLLDDMEEEQKNTLLEAIEERIQLVNSRQMEELGIDEDENPLQYIIPNFLSFSTTLDNASDEMQEMEINNFNTKFENYAGTNLSGASVKGLITTITINNGLEDSEGNDIENENEDINSKYLIKEIHFDGEEYEVNRQNLTLIKSNIETETAYRVEFEKDEQTGIIYRVVINKK